MALIFMDGFDHCSNINQKPWDSSFATTSGGRFGTGRYIHQPGNVIKTLPSNYGTIFVGCAVQALNFTSTATVIALRDTGTAQVDLRVDSAGKLFFTRNGTTIGSVSANSLTTNAWNYIEIKVLISATVGTVDVHVNGVSWTSASGLDTKNATNATANQIVVGSAAQSLDFDDLYVCDTSGTQNNDFLGDVRIFTLAPNGAGSSTQWSLTGAASNNAACADATPDDDTSYVSSSTPGDIDSYAMADLSVTGSVLGLAVNVRARKDDAGTRTIHTYLKSSSATAESADVDLSTSYAGTQKIHETDPNGPTAWTVSGVNAVEAGVKEIA